jgi:hypothetical protein
MVGQGLDGLGHGGFPPCIQHTAYYCPLELSREILGWIGTEARAVPCRVGGGGVVQTGEGNQAKNGSRGSRWQEATTKPAELGLHPPASDGSSLDSTKNEILDREADQNHREEPGEDTRDLE